MDCWTLVVCGCFMEELSRIFFAKYLVLTKSQNALFCFCNIPCRVHVDWVWKLRSSLLQFYVRVLFLFLHTVYV